MTSFVEGEPIVNHSKIVVIALILVTLSTGCATRSTHVQAIDGPTQQPNPGQAELVFLRPSTRGEAFQASVYDVTDGQLEFIGIVSAGTRINHQAASRAQTWFQSNRRTSL
jgi:hypothetical protein